jgi:hypothetical protein
LFYAFFVLFWVVSSCNIDHHEKSSRDGKIDDTHKKRPHAAGAGRHEEKKKARAMENSTQTKKTTAAAMVVDGCKNLNNTRIIN